MAGTETAGATWPEMLLALGAAYKGNVAMVRLLLAHGASVEGMAPDGKTARMEAAAR